MISNIEPLNKLEPPLPQLSLCIHCGRRPVEKHQKFCCAGCEVVYSLIHEKGLDYYYDLKVNGECFENSSDAEVFFETSKQSTLANDMRSPQGKYEGLRLALLKSTEPELRLYIEGIQCTACLWILDRLDRLSPLVKESHLHLASKVLQIRFHTKELTDENLHSLEKLLGQLGYRPHWIFEDSDTFALREKESRRELIRIGVAAASTGNIMLLAISIYAGASGTEAFYFNLLMTLLAAPVMTWCAWPIYVSALSFVKTRKVSIDLPIALAILSGCILSLYSLIKGLDRLYFDSLSMLVFLLLSGRYTLNRMQQGVLEKNSLLKVLLKQNNVQKNSTISVSTDERVSADGELLSAEGEFDFSWLTGESAPQILKRGSTLYAGVLNVGPKIEMKVHKAGTKTRMGQLLEKLESGDALRSKIYSFSDQVGQGFSTVVLLASVALFVVLAQQNVQVAFERSLTLLLITCPCVLAFALPLTLRLGMIYGSKLGVLVKSAEAFERAVQAKTIFLDKTGTLTHSDLTLTKYVFHSVDSASSLNDSQLKEVLKKICESSRHPVSKATYQWLESFSIANSPELLLQSIQEIPGYGLSADLQMSFSREPRTLKIEFVRSREIQNQTSSTLYLNGIPRAQFWFSHQLFEQTREEVAQLQKLGLEVKVLSGDQPEVVQEIAKHLAIPASNSYAQMTPEQKASLVETTPHSVMVGDGMNDALALTRASLGIAVRGSLESSIQSADAMLLNQGIRGLISFFQLSTFTLKVAKRNLWFSGFYNLVGGSLAITGYCTPLWAAALMPLSALTVFGVTYLAFQFRYLAKWEKLA